MSGEFEDRPETSSARVGWGWVCWLGVIPVLYLLSIGPAAMMVERRLIKNGTPGFRAIQIAYAPMEWAWQRLPPVRKPLGMYLHLWVPNRWDSKGNIT